MSAPNKVYTRTHLLGFYIDNHLLQFDGMTAMEVVLYNELKTSLYSIHPGFFVVARAIDGARADMLLSSFDKFANLAETSLLQPALNPCSPDAVWYIQVI